jgi:hypothetical protein
MRVLADDLRKRDVMIAGLTLDNSATPLARTASPGPGDSDA